MTSACNEMYAMRLQLGDEAFRKAIAQQFFGDAQKAAYLALAKSMPTSLLVGRTRLLVHAFAGEPTPVFSESDSECKTQLLLPSGVYCLPSKNRQFSARACNRAAAFHGSRFAPVCSALLFCHRCERPKSDSLAKPLSSCIQDLIR